MLKFKSEKRKSLMKIDIAEIKYVDLIKVQHFKVSNNDIAYI